MAVAGAFAVLGFLAFVTIVIALVVWGIVVARRRAEEARRARQELAQRIGLVYEPKPMENLFATYRGLLAMPAGSRRYAENLLRGFHRGVDVRCFDYTYVTQSTDSKGHTHDTYHHVAVAIAGVGERFPRLTVVPETWGYKIWDALGGDDIDFESDEFSRRFWVKSTDKKFAYDVLHARAMEFLLASEWKHWEVSGGTVAMWASGRWSIDRIVPGLDRLVDFVELMPSYLRTTPSGNRSALPPQAQWREGWWETAKP